MGMFESLSHTNAPTDHKHLGMTIACVRVPWLAVTPEGKVSKLVHTGGT